MRKITWLLDPGANARNERRISAAGAPVAVHVLPADEERAVARHARALATDGSASAEVA